MTNISRRWRTCATAASRSASSMPCTGAISTASDRDSAWTGWTKTTAASSQHGLASAGCLARRDQGTEALAQALPARAGVERQYFADGRSRASQRISVGRHSRRRNCGRLQAEASGLSRGLCGFRSCAASLHDGGGAQLRSESSGGLRIADRACRKAGRGRDRAPEKAVPSIKVDVAAKNFVDLARKLKT